MQTTTCVIVPPPRYFDFMQFDQKVRKYHLTDTDIVITKIDFLCVTSGANTWGAKLSSINCEVLQNARRKPE